MTIIDLTKRKVLLRRDTTNRWNAATAPSSLKEKQVSSSDEEEGKGPDSSFH